MNPTCFPPADRLWTRPLIAGLKVNGLMSNQSTDHPHAQMKDPTHSVHIPRSPSYAYAYPSTPPNPVITVADV